MRYCFDLQLPRETKQQAALSRALKSIRTNAARRPGLFQNGFQQNGLHVGIDDTNNQFIHALPARE
ncbi:hypothetical protein ACNKHN_08640 [Shigella flexneri]